MASMTSTSSVLKAEPWCFAPRVEQHNVTSMTDSANIISIKTPLGKQLSGHITTAHYTSPGYEWAHILHELHIHLLVTEQEHEGHLAAKLSCPSTCAQCTECWGSYWYTTAGLQISTLVCLCIHDLLHILLLVTLVDPWNVGMCVCTCVSMYVCMYVCICTYICMYMCMYVCMYVFMHAITYVQLCSVRQLHISFKNQPSWGHKIHRIHRNTYARTYTKTYLSVANSSWAKLQTRYTKIFFFTLQLIKETRIWLCKGIRCKIHWEHVNWVTNQKCTYGTKLQLRSP